MGEWNGSGIPLERILSRAVQQWSSLGKNTVSRAVQQWDSLGKNTVSRAVQEWDTLGKNTVSRAVQQWDSLGKKTVSRAVTSAMARAKQAVAFCGLDKSHDGEMSALKECSSTSVSNDRNGSCHCQTTSITLVHL